MSAKMLFDPTDSNVNDSQIVKFITAVNASRGSSIETYEDLWNLSVEDPEVFWREVAGYFGLSAQHAADRVLSGDPMPCTRWFPSTSLNYAQYVLAAQGSNQVAISGYDELGETRKLNGSELAHEVQGLAAHLKNSGVEAGDRVVGYVSNAPEAVVALLAASALGAIWSCVGLDYAAEAAADRLAPLDPTAMIVSLNYTYKGQVRSAIDQASHLVSLLPTLKNVVTFSQRGSAEGVGALLSDVSVTPWEAAIDNTPVVVRDVEFNTPLWVLFSSGTTGRPKGIMHSHGGILIELLKMLSFHLDVANDDVFLWHTSPSWVMWNIQASALATGASIVTFDGHPSYPTPAALWNVVEDADVTVFGASPGFLELSRSWSESPLGVRAAQRLRTVGTSGEPIKPETHEWAMNACGGSPVHSISGGTDICSAFAAGAQNLPIYAGEISGACLGVSLGSWNDSGEAVTEEVGELVVTRPMPSMPVAFWDDPEGQKYRDAYFGHFEGVWRHGDWITITERSSIIFHGRSDATINRHGVRMGSSDIYNCVDSLPGVRDSLVLGIELGGGQYWMPLFIVPEQPGEVTDVLRDQIRSSIQEQVSPRHVPDDVLQIEEVPRTLTGKRLEVPLKRIIQGGRTGDSIQESAMANPEALQAFLEVAFGKLHELQQSSS